MVYSQHESEGYRKLNGMALAFLDQMKVGPVPGVYKKEACKTGPSTYGCYHATQVLHLFGELQKMPKENLDTWASHIQALQSGNGYFSNRASDANKPRILRQMDPVWHFTRGMIWVWRCWRRGIGTASPTWIS